MMPPTPAAEFRCKWCVPLGAPTCDFPWGDEWSWFCTRPPGHDGPHVACGALQSDHDLARCER